MLEDKTAIIESNKHFNDRKDYMFTEEELSFIRDELKKQTEEQRKNVKNEKEMTDYFKHNLSPEQQRALIKVLRPYYGLKNNN